MFAIFDGIAFYAKEGNYYSEYSKSECWLNAQYVRQATPEEMAQFDGGAE